MRGEHAKTDISKLSRTFGTIFHYSRKLPSLERMFDRAAEIDEIKHGIANHLYNGDTGREIPLELDAYRSKNKAGYKKLNEYLIHQDIDRIGGWVNKTQDEKFAAYNYE